MPNLISNVLAVVFLLVALALFGKAANVLADGFRALPGRVRQHGYGWDCPDCRICAGHPGNAFASHYEAADALAVHMATTHPGDSTPDVWVGEIYWTGPRVTRD